MALPIGHEDGFKGVVDLVAMKAYTYSGTTGKAAEGPIPDDLSDAAAEARERLVDRVAEADDALSEKYLEGGELTQQEVGAALRAAVAAGSVSPVDPCGGYQEHRFRPFARDSSVRSVARRARGAHGVPGPRRRRSRAPRAISRLPPRCSSSRPSTTSSQDGSTSRGSSRARSPPTRSCSTSAPARKSVPATSCSCRARRRRPSRRQGPATSWPWPNSRRQVRVTPCPTRPNRCGSLVTSSRRRPSLSPSLPRLGETRRRSPTACAAWGRKIPAMELRFDPQTKEMLISGTSQVHVEVILDKLKRRFGVEVELHPPQVPYRETIRKKANAQGRHKKQTGGRGQFGDCWIEVEPQPRGGGLQVRRCHLRRFDPSQLHPGSGEGQSSRPWSTA